MAKLIIDIEPDGFTKVEAQGFTGNACAVASEQIEVAIGGAGSRKKKKKPEFFASPSTKSGNKLTF